ncbi:MAG: TatD family nuclease-associated radical SAM protein [Clostridiales bacterium]|nr:TatD family nuclease-associated radical SAM protein [Clostridiales bacterium]
MNFLYRLGKNLYVNLTNACCCDCIFCIRKFAEGINENESLWLRREPTVSEVKDAFEKRRDLNDICEIVFCGFGEPLERADDVVELIDYFYYKKVTLPLRPKIRIDTNGLVKLINPSFDIARLSKVDIISVSLNADDEGEYMRLTQPRFENAYKEMLNFVKEAKKFADIILTVVEILHPYRIDNCRKIAEDLGVAFRVRQ